jgi:hypothetical protein
LRLAQAAAALLWYRSLWLFLFLLHGVLGKATRHHGGHFPLAWRLALAATQACRLGAIHRLPRALRRVLTGAIRGPSGGVVLFVSYLL